MVTLLCACSYCGWSVDYLGRHAIRLRGKWLHPECTLGWTNSGDDNPAGSEALHRYFLANAGFYMQEHDEGLLTQ